MKKLLIITETSEVIVELLPPNSCTYRDCSCDLCVNEESIIAPTERYGDFIDQFEVTSENIRDL